jgi:hypothetical protein
VDEIEFIIMMAMTARDALADAEAQNDPPLPKVVIDAFRAQNEVYKAWENANGS